MSLVESLNLPLGSDIIDFDLMATDGSYYSAGSFSFAQVLVIVFTCNHCPYAQAIEKRLIDFQLEYSRKGVQVLAINSNDAINFPEDDFENMKKLAEKKQYPFLYLYDETQKVAKDYQAQCTPDLYVYDQDRKLAYHGRFDDNWQDETKVRHKDLKSAVEAILRGINPAIDQVPSQGCSIKWK